MVTAGASGPAVAWVRWDEAVGTAAPCRTSAIYRTEIHRGSATDPNPQQLPRGLVWEGGSRSFAGRSTGFVKVPAGPKRSGDLTKPSSGPESAREPHSSSNSHSACIRTSPPFLLTTQPEPIETPPVSHKSNWTPIRGARHVRGNPTTATVTTRPDIRLGPGNRSRSSMPLSWNPMPTLRICHNSQSPLLDWLAKTSLAQGESGRKPQKA